MAGHLSRSTKNVSRRRARWSRRMDFVHIDFRCTTNFTVQYPEYVQCKKEYKSSHMRRIHISNNTVNVYYWQGRQSGTGII